MFVSWGKPRNEFLPKGGQLMRQVSANFGAMDLQKETRRVSGSERRLVYYTLPEQAVLDAKVAFARAAESAVEVSAEVVAAEEEAIAALRSKPVAVASFASCAASAEGAPAVGG